MANETILVVDDEEHILELIRFNLSSAGYEVITVESGEEALNVCKANTPDLILLDIMLPGIDGLEVCSRLKMISTAAQVPIIMLTAKSEEIDKIVGLELGADDYITKPFSIRELNARVKALLRRSTMHSVDSSSSNSQLLKFGDITIDIENYEVYKGNEKLELTLKEFELLKILAVNKGKVLTRDHLLDQIWGYEYYGETRTVDVHIRHLRSKIGDEFIETIRGVGYKFNFVGE